MFGRKIDGYMKSWLKDKLRIVYFFFIVYGLVIYIRVGYKDVNFRFGKLIGIF